MDFTLRHLQRRIASGEVPASENYNKLKRVCPYSQKSVELAIKVLKATGDCGEAIDVYLTGRGWIVKKYQPEVPDIPNFFYQADPPLHYPNQKYILWSRDLFGSCALWHQRRMFLTGVGTRAEYEICEQRIIAWAKRRAQFAWYYSLTYEY